MGKRIPRSIQEKVISKWLDGKSRDVVARELRISGGSVSSIIQGRRRKDRQFDLLRVVTVQLKQRGLTVEEFAPLIRCRELIKPEYSESGKTIDEEEEEVESLMEALCIFCFNRKETVPEFGNLVHGLYRIADKLGIALYDLHTYVNSLADRAAALRTKVDLLQTKEKRFLKHYMITVGTVKEIISRGPYMLGAYFDMKARAQMSDNEKIRYKDQLLSLQFEIKARKIKAAKKSSLKYVLSNLQGPSTESAVRISNYYAKSDL
jgi:hypothetical protein